MNTKDKLQLMKELDTANAKHIQDWKEREDEKMAGKITGILVDVVKGTIDKATIDKSLDGYYAALNCRCIDIVSRTVGGKRFLVICDDEGLLKNDIKVSAIAPSGEVMLVGNLFIVNSDGADDVESLTDEECQHIKRCAYTVRMSHEEKAYPVLNYCGY